MTHDANAALPTFVAGGQILDRVAGPACKASNRKPRVIAEELVQRAVRRRAESIPTEAP